MNCQCGPAGTRSLSRVKLKPAHAYHCFVMVKECVRSSFLSRDATSKRRSTLARATQAAWGFTRGRGIHACRALRLRLAGRAAGYCELESFGVANEDAPTAERLPRKCAGGIRNEGAIQAREGARGRVRATRQPAARVGTAAYTHIVPCQRLCAHPAARNPHQSRAAPAAPAWPRKTGPCTTQRRRPVGPGARAAERHGGTARDARWMRCRRAPPRPRSLRAGPSSERAVRDSGMVLPLGCAVLAAVLVV